MSKQVQIWKWCHIDVDVRGPVVLTLNILGTSNSCLVAEMYQHLVGCSGCSSNLSNNLLNKSCLCLLSQCPLQSLISSYSSGVAVWLDFCHHGLWFILVVWLGSSSTCPTGFLVLPCFFWKQTASRCTFFSQWWHNFFVSTVWWLMLCLTATNTCPINLGVARLSLSFVCRWWIFLIYLVCWCGLVSMDNFLGNLVCISCLWGNLDCFGEG